MLVLATFVLTLFAAPARASQGVGEAESAWARLTAGTEDAVQSRVLDPILGPGRSRVFVSGALKEERARAGDSHVGTGKADKKKGTQHAEQTKSSEDSTETWRLGLDGETVVVLYDAALSKADVDAARAALLAVYPDSLSDKSLRFVPAPFRAAPPMR
ncbi:MAG: hypothetical protein KGL53_17175 [Elusimicrobia bacterium]|nr:hypothetical protein [Elusimicrobiota bacterium]